MNEIYPCLLIKGIYENTKMQKYEYFFISLLNSTKDVKRVVKKNKNIRRCFRGEKRF